MKENITYKDFSLHESEILRYLGYGGQEIPKNILDKIRGVKKECEDFFTPKYVYEEYNLKKREDEIELIGTNLILKGKDIYNLLKNCNRCVLMAVTLGNSIERSTRFYEKVDLTKALILDACATTAVEEFCDLVEEKIKSKCVNEGEVLTFRYSPGYGDLDLDVQKDFIDVLNCKKKIGINVSEHMILFPRKSVTAILGIKKSSGKNKKKSCINCNNYKSCMYRKEEIDVECKRVY